MKTRLTILSLLSVTILLSGCVGREQADANLQKGCEAAVKLHIPTGFTLKEIKSVSFSTPSDTTDGNRKVNMNVIESDGWYDGDKVYSCNFLEEFGFLNMTHKVEIYQVNVGGQIYGKQGGNIMGGVNEWQKIMDAVAGAINN